ncbi:MAG: TetR/AcrR family transcriptional regulator [Victivallaceae bacterium]
MQERAKITREKVLQTAIEHFSARGFFGARVNDIADAAGANKQRIYANFQSKSGLFEACLKRVFEEVSLFSEKSRKQVINEPEKLTAVLLEDFMSIHKKYPHFWRMLAWANLDDEVAVEQLTGIRKKEDLIIRQAFEQAQKRGAIKKELSFETYLFTLMAVSYFYSSNRKTLARTLSPAIYTSGGREQLMREVTSMLS